VVAPEETRPAGRAQELGALGEELRHRLAGAHRAREVALARCRETIRTSGRSIRAVHRLETDQARQLAGEAEATLRQAQEALDPFPSLAAAGFLHDAEKEYVEARMTAALVDGSPLASASDLGVGEAAWCNGLAEAASELRRHLLDRLREGQQDRAATLLAAMDDVYGLLVTIDFPDAITGGLRRTTDALRAVLERSRSDLTTTILQGRLQEAIERAVARWPE
jgi:translin